MQPKRATLDAPSVITADVAADSSALDALMTEWDHLFAASDAQNPFLTSAWIDCWRRCVPDGAGLHVIAVRSRGILIGVAPLIQVRRGLSECLEFMGTGPAGADYLDLLAARGSETDVINAVAAVIEARQLPLYLDHLPPSSLAARVAEHLKRSRWTTIETSPDVCPYITLAAHTWDSYLQSLGPAHRANVRRRLRALHANFDVQFSAVTSHPALRKALDALVRFSERRWQDRGGTSAFPTLAFVAFHHQLTSRALDEGWLRLYTLTLNGAIAGVMYGFALDDRFFFYQHGFNEMHAAHSVGLVVMALSIRAAIDSGLREFDMLYGHESYKALWAREHRRLARIEMFPPRLSGTLLRTQAETRRALRTLTHRLGLLG